MAFVIAWPLSRWLMNLWLEHFAYRINTGIWIYLIAGGLMLAAAQSAIIYQCIKAATTNPVESLRYE
jgi:putative ABC transport system permease protein